MKEFPKRIMDLLREVAKDWQDSDGTTYKKDAESAIAWIEARAEFTDLADSTHSDAANFITRRAGGRLMTNADGHELLCFYSDNLKSAANGLSRIWSATALTWMMRLWPATLSKSLQSLSITI